MRSSRISRCNRASCATPLKSSGWRRGEASTGPEGIWIYRREHDAIDGVLLDLSMPGMFGLEVLQILREINPRVRVLLASGLIDEEDVIRAQSLGVRGFLYKPYSADELSRKIREILL